MISNSKDSNLVLVLVFLILDGVLVKIIILNRLWVELLPQHHLLEKNNGAHSMIQSQLVLIKLRQNGTDVEMGVSLSFWSLKSTFNSKSPLQKVQGGPHLADSSVVAGHVIEGHGLSELIVFAKLL